MEAGCDQEICAVFVQAVVVAHGVREGPRSGGAQKLCGRVDADAHEFLCDGVEEGRRSGLEGAAEGLDETASDVESVYGCLVDESSVGQVEAVEGLEAVEVGLLGENGTASRRWSRRGPEKNECYTAAKGKSRTPPNAAELKLENSRTRELENSRTLEL